MIETLPVADIRTDFPVDRVDPRAIEVVEVLRAAGHEAYIVGGGVRDLLLGHRPKDFDVATSAHPPEVRKLFHRSRLIGRRFPIVHVLFGREFIEVTTFRSIESKERLLHESGRILHDSSYGTLSEDAVRRDFSVNALYYDPQSGQVIDQVGGLSDLTARRLRLIGDATERYREDPVRMLRAIRFVTKLDFRFAPETEGPIYELAPLLEDIPPSRLFEEFTKLFLLGAGELAFKALRQYKVLRHLFPLTAELIEADETGKAEDFILAAIRDTDRRVAMEESVTPAFLLAALIWPPIRRYSMWLCAEGMSEAAALQRASAVIISECSRRVSIPRRYAQVLREIIHLQPRFRYRKGRRAEQLFSHSRFRAAYDFLSLRVAVEGISSEGYEFWTSVQSLTPEERTRKFATRRRKQCH